MTHQNQADSEKMSVISQNGLTGITPGSPIFHPKRQGNYPMPMEFPWMTGDAVKRRWEGREEGAPLDDPSCGLRSERQGQRKTIREALGILDRCFCGKKDHWWFF